MPARDGWKKSRPPRKPDKPLPYTICHYDHKRSFKRRKDVDSAMKHLARQDPDRAAPPNAYWCPQAGAWHITSKTRADYSRNQAPNRRTPVTDPAAPDHQPPPVPFDALDPGTYTEVVSAIPNREIKPVEVTLACPCGSPIELVLRGETRDLPAGADEPLAELVTLVVQTKHHKHDRQDAFGMYIADPR